MNKRIKTTKRANDLSTNKNFNPIRTQRKCETEKIQQQQNRNKKKKKHRDDQWRFTMQKHKQRNDTCIA